MRPGLSVSVLFLAGILIGEEEKLYKAAEERSGGWRGWKNFMVDSVEDKTKNTKTFTFKPETPVKGSFDFTAGQYLSVKVDPFKDGSLTAPRHYTITVSTYMLIYSYVHTQQSLLNELNYCYIFIYYIVKGG